MSKGKSSLSKAKSYKEIGIFWDTHDLSDFWDKTKEVGFEVNIESEITFMPMKSREALISAQ
ncbi:MAG: BrnA antitoxin family protein [Desulfobacteraceae bacterium]|nr:BrnA antitoxin family protein [Pseudomonadota bacterium]MBU4414148.1 BrnA antitoxin family protein [Pseudomonadota bacterium]MCG2757170.1 BrnA antitoxin family protein [Desulfobacteraceae bacterium]